VEICQSPSICTCSDIPLGVVWWWAALCVKILLSFAASCTTAVTGWSQLLANWIGDGHCTGGGSCTLTNHPVLSHGGMWHWSAMCGSHGAVWKYCYAWHWKESRCGMAQLVALEKLVDDEEEAQCTSLALGLPWSHWRGAKASQTQETWSNVWFPDWGTYSVSPPTYIHVPEIK